jgi:LysM repeat protein
MNRTGYHRMLLLAVLLLLLVSGGVQAQQNLLTNPGFENPYTDQGGDPARQVAQGWTAWHVGAGANEPNFQNQQPEYLPTAPDATRIRNGNNAQSYNSFFTTHTGGVYQQVSGVTPGTALTFSVYAYIWSSTFDEVDVSEDDGGVILQVGIDPNGGTDGQSDSVVYSDVAAGQYDAYFQYTTSAVAANSTVTVFVRSTVSSPVKNNFVYLDDASLVVGQAQPQPTTPPRATNTPSAAQPTSTPGATGTPVPVDEARFPGRIIHAVRAQDTIQYLAQLYGSDLDLIIQLNGLNPNGFITVGQQLVIPVRIPNPVPVTAAPQPTGQPQATSTPRPQATSVPQPTATTRPPVTGTTSYTVQPGDTLTTIAARFNTTVATLSQLNGIVNPDRIFWGQRIVVPAPGAPPATATPRPQATVRPTATQPPTSQPVTYIVQPGDTLFRISVRFGVSVAQLIQLNGIANPNLIFIGQVLTVR